MKYLVFGLTFAAFALAQRPQVSECFKVRELLRADEEHYWATWTNSCPYTIDAVYVMVRFADRSSKTVSDGVWALHFIPAGAHRTMRFSAPGKLADFASIHQRKITTDMNEAFGKPATPLSAVEMAAVSAYRGAVVKKDVERSVLPVSTVIMDSGEVGYAAASAYKEAVLKDVLAGADRVMAASEAPPGRVVNDPGEASFRTDFPDSWRAVLTPQESSVTVAPRGSFVRFVDDRPIFR
jgi:hypothetical protein